MSPPLPQPAIWRRAASAEAVNRIHEGSLCGLLGIRVTEIGPDWLTAEMPVDQRHLQPFGLLHGGASVVLAETLGSTCALLATPDGTMVVGVEVNANHLAPVRSGETVRALCKPLQVGRSVQVWQIEITRGDGRLACVARLTALARQERE
jgi:1,4-dihydroxy-2-naphthoyl-CoA hydrolase